MKNIGWLELNNSFICRDLAEEGERGPKIGVGVLLSKLLHGGLQGGGHIACFHIARVEGLHKVGGAAVVYVPEGKEERGSAGAEEAALETEEFVSSGDEIHACGTAAEGDVTG